MEIVGERLKYMRQMLGLTQEELAKQVGKKHYNISNHEKMKNLDLRITRDTLTFFKQSGINFTEEWLSTGIGEIPSFKQYTTILDKDFDLIKKSDLQKAYQEIMLLEKLSEDFAYLQISDESMEPKYLYGDYVGGDLIDGTKIKEYDNTYCGFYIKNDIFVRKVNIDEEFVLCTPSNLKFRTIKLQYHQITKFFMVTWQRTINKNNNFYKI